MKKLLFLALLSVSHAYAAICTDTGVSVTVTSVTLLAGNSGYSSLMIQNPDGANPIYVGIGHAATTADIKIAAGNSLSFPTLVPASQLYAISTGGTVAAVVVGCSQ